MIVTTTRHPTAAMVTRAQQVAARCRAPYTLRRQALAYDDDGLVYVVRRDRDELRAVGARLSASLGRLEDRRQAGRNHPLVAALAPTGARRIVDATLGLGRDAIHIAAVVGCEVVGIEGSPAIFSLVEEGLPRLARFEPATSQVRACFGDAREVLASMAPGSADAVYLSPGFAEQKHASPGSALFRTVGNRAPLDHALLQAACRVARDRVVVCVAPGEGVQVGRERSRVHGSDVDYVVLEPPC